MEHPAPQDGGELYHQDAGHKMKAPSKGKLANLRSANFIPYRRRALAVRRFSTPVPAWINTFPRTPAVLQSKDLLPSLKPEVALSTSLYSLALSITPMV